MHRRPIFTILIATLLVLIAPSLLSSDSVAGATAGKTFTLDEALLLMLSSELWLTGGGDPVALNQASDLSLPSAPAGGLLRTTTLNGSLDLAAALPRSAGQTEVSINAVKQLITMKMTAYEQSAISLEGKISPEILLAQEQKQQQEIQQLNDQLEELRKQWRREKRFWPKLAKPFKQAGSWFWHKIGPAGRRLLRSVGDDLIRMAVTGDPISGRIIRMLIVKHVRTMGEAKGTQFLLRLYFDGRQKESQATATTIEEVTAEIEKKSFDEIWAVIVEALESEHRTCQTYLIELYKECIIGNSDETTEWLDVVALCRPLYDQIPKNDPGGTVTMSVDMGQDDPAGPGERITYKITYPSAGGQVTGSYDYYHDANVAACRQTVTATFLGDYSLSDCTMSGVAKVSYKVQPLTEIEGWGPLNREDCFITGNIPAQDDAFEVPVPWQAKLKNGDLSVRIGEEGCNGGPFCRNLWFDVWEDEQEAGN